MSINLHTLNQAQHSVAVGDGTNLINLDGSGNVNVIATDLDIRDLTSVSDSVSAVQSGTWDIGTVTTLTGITNDVNIADGGNSITVDFTRLDRLTDNIAIQDAAGDELAINADGSLNVQGTFTTNPGGYSDWQTKQVAMSTSAAQLDATPLAGRINVVVQNIGSSDVYLSDSNAVSTSTGILLAKGSSQEIALDDTATATLWGITDAGTSTVAFAEYKA